jgi:hypothetical protein
MTSLNAPESLYILQEPTIFKEKKYNPNFIMSYVWSKSPVFAHCIQTAGLEDWFNAETFNSTVLIPCKEYSDAYLNYFIENLSVMTARDIVLCSTLPGRISYQTLCNEEYIPTYNKYNELGICEKDGILLNGQLRVVRPDMEFMNGMIHVINGLITPAYSV